MPELNVDLLNNHSTLLLTELWSVVGPMDRLRSERNTSGGTSVGRDTLSTAVIKNVFTVALCISINYINGTLVHTFTRHQVSRPSGPSPAILNRLFEEFEVFYASSSF